MKPPRAAAGERCRELASSASPAAPAPPPRTTPPRSPPATAERAAACGARQDRRQQRAAAARDEQEKRLPRRLLEVLQDGVGGAAVHVVGGVDDDDAPAPLARRRAEERDDAPHRLHRQLRSGSACRCSFQSRCRCRRFPCAPMATRRAAGCSAGTERSSRRRHLRRARVGMREDEARQPEGERRLTDPALAGKDPAVVHAPGPVGIEQRLLRRRDARRGSSSRAAASRLRARRAAAAPPRSSGRAPCVSPTCAASGAERRPQSRIASATASARRCRRVDDDAALRARGGDVEKRLPPRLVQRHLVRLEPVGRRARGSASARARARPARRGSASGRAGRRRRRSRRAASSSCRIGAGSALIGARGIDEAVGDHPAAGLRAPDGSVTARWSARASAKASASASAPSGGKAAGRGGARATPPRAGCRPARVSPGRRSPARAASRPGCAACVGFSCPLPAFQRDEAPAPAHSQPNSSSPSASSARAWSEPRPTAAAV